MSESLSPYRVLARKYRPASFDALIGQDAMVQTLGNAIARDRLAHAFLLTGIRGVGKTSTARLIAKALNCIGADGQGGPTIAPCGTCEHCQAIGEGRHIDVVEMDAASHTGVDDVREIIEAVRYASVSARYKVYIIDEVHMLSKSAFNALLKTLEEPPAHVKFLFATTEVNKVPVTVLSRCQRFDLRRIPAEKLVEQFSRIVGLEGVAAEPEALALIARAAEGSVRDGLSILDQAIAHAQLGDGEGRVTASQVREMLGLSDRGAVRRLFALLLEGNGAQVLAEVRAQYDLGAEPAALFRALLELVHGITRARMAGAEDPSQSFEEREALTDWASRMGFATLHRLWQLLLKGLDEVQGAPLPIEAAEMALLRILHASSLPDPGELVRRLTEGGPASAAPAAAPSPAPAAVAQLRAPADFAALVALAESRGEALLATRLHDDVGLVSYAPPEMALKPLGPLPATFAADLARHLRGWTGASWLVSLRGDAEAQPSLRQQEIAAEHAARDAILADPLVAAAMAAFPDAELAHFTTPQARSA
jgi:DNA polymerase III subunit gamma/tau